MEELQIKYRFERKFILPSSIEHIIKKNLVKDCFYEAFPERKINNIYFDSLERDSYVENLEGYSKRSKTRIRWYGETFDLSEKVLEIKVKEDDVNYKENFNLGPIKYFDPIIKNNFLNDIKNIRSNYLKKINFLPVIFNNYTREYYTNDLLKTRVTIDKNLNFLSLINNFGNSELNYIMEIKYDKENSFYNNINKILQLGKYSKYVSGINYTMY